jgi:hypothetical protein
MKPWAREGRRNVDKAKAAIRGKVQNEVSKAKTADDLNRIIAKHIEILDKPGATLHDIRLAEAISGLIGRQVSIENAKISYERLTMANTKKYNFVL